MKRMMTICAALLLAASQLTAGARLDLKEITNGAFRGESMAAVEPLSDGESYAQISQDGRQIVSYSFRTGKQTGCSSTRRRRAVRR